MLKPSVHPDDAHGVTWMARVCSGGCQKSLALAGMEDARETRVRDGPLEVVTLHVVMDTPRQRKLSESYTRQWTPIGELPAARRKRRSAESSARSRAMCRLQPGKHAQQLADRKRKRDAAPKQRRDAGRGRTRPAQMDSEWQRAEIDRQLRCTNGDCASGAATSGAEGPSSISSSSAFDLFTLFDDARCCCCCSQMYPKL